MPKQPTNRPMEKIGRLVLRSEGTMWNAYYAMPDTLVDALFLGGIALRFVRGYPERRQSFIDICREAVGDIIEEKFGTRPIWGSEHPASDIERGGHA